MTGNSAVSREIDTLKQRLLFVGAKVEAALRKAVRALNERDIELAHAVIRDDQQVDRLEVELEEQCLNVLADYHPRELELRFVVAVLKINNDLERVGDHAVSIAEHALFLAERPPLALPFDYDLMAEKAEWMLRTSLDAFVSMNRTAAEKVCATDDEVDDLNRQMYEAVEKAMRRNPEHLDSLINSIGLSRCFERIADLATNVAEDVIYLIEGEIVRHAGAIG